jgi:nucleoside-diphosphate-sugar epimerase
MPPFNTTITGLGWLGLPLYKQLSKSGLKVCGSKTSVDDVEKYKAEGLNVFHLRLNPEVEGDSLNEWLNCETLVINIPPSRRIENIEELYPAQIKNLVKLVSPQTKIVFVGSTSVFGEVAGGVDDHSPFNPETPSARALVACEEWLKQNRPESVVVRFAGLYGPERHPGRFFARKVAEAGGVAEARAEALEALEATHIPNGDSPVNFIHQTDAVRVLEKIIIDDFQNLSINACAPQHSTKREYYQRASAAGKFAQPAFLPGGADSKVVLTSWLNSQNFRFEKGIYSFD